MLCILLFLATFVEASVFPQPNYNAKTKYQLDRLFDGEWLSRGNIWNKGKALEWRKRSPVAISIPYKSRSEAIIRIHTSRNENSGVSAPKFASVYCTNKQNDQHLKSQFFKEELVGNKKNAWLEIGPIPACMDELVIVVHSRGDLMMIDEIDVISKNAKSIKKRIIQNSSEDSRLHLMSVDSRNRLKVYYKNQNLARFMSNNERLHFSLSQLGSSSVNNINEAVLWSEEQALYVYLTIENSTLRDERFTVNFDKNIEIVSVDEVKKVMASNGVEQFDLIKPSSLAALSGTVKSGETKVFGVSLKGVDRSVGAVLSTNKAKYPLEVVVNALPSLSKIPEPMAKLMAGGWGYFDINEPIFKQEISEDVEFLVSDGVDLFYVHPSRIYKPFQMTAKGWKEKSNRKQFIELMAAQSNADKIIIFLNWNKKWESVSDKKLAIWLDKIKKDMALSGFDKDDWYLYPIDELNKFKYKKYGHVYKKIKKLNPDVQLYANPSGRNKSIPSNSQIQELVKYVEFLQPRRGEAYDRVKIVLADSDKHLLGFYDNLKAPVKSRPAACYRELAWSAFELSAKAISTWSISQTNGASAIDDFDGFGPDWAMLYEIGSDLDAQPVGAAGVDDKKRGFYLSVRYQAFLAGLKDYQYLSYCAATLCPNFEDYKSRMLDVFKAECGT